MGVFVTGRQVMLEIPMPGWWLSGASVDLDFDSGRYYDSSTPNPRAATDFLSCTRASSGYAKTSLGTLTSFASNALRITDLGLLVEDARTNLAIDSQDPSTSTWNKSFVSLGGLVTAPDGTTTAANIIEDSSANYHRVFRTAGGVVVVPSTAAVTGSIYIKNGATNGRRYIGVQLVDGSVGLRQSVVVDTVAGAITQTGTQGSPPSPAWHLETLGSGWYRVDITFNMTSGDNCEVDVFGCTSATPTLDGFGLQSYTGDGVSNFYVWGNQVEMGAFPSSYIPTTGTSATRAADSIAISGSAQTTIAAATGSIVAQIGTQGGTGFAANIVDSNGTNVLGFNASNNALASLVATLATANAGNRNAGDDKLGLAWSGAGRSIVLNGGTVATDASAQTPSSTQKLGSANATSNFIYAYVERLTLFNSKLADATLQGFTR